MSLKGSLEKILPHIHALEPYLTDPDVTEVMVNQDLTVWVERAGRLQLVPADLTEESLRHAIGLMAKAAGHQVINAANPILDAPLEGGTRIAAIIGPASADGKPMLTIRKFPRRFTLTELIGAGTLTPEHGQVLWQAVQDRQTILISGGTGSGKTTLLNALADQMDPADRVAILEDTSEISISAANQFRLQTRRVQDDLPAVTMSDLVRATLRHRPDRIILGEVRGPEAWDLLQVLNTGHVGSLSTMHANSATAALERLAQLAMGSKEALPYEHIKAAILMAVQVVVQMARQDGRRRVVEVLSVWASPAAADARRLVVPALTAPLAPWPGKTRF